VVRFVGEQTQDWDVAEQSCLMLGSRLVTLNTLVEKDFVAKR